MTADHGDPPAGLVETVRGPVAVADLGQTLMHEHIVTINAELARDHPTLSWGDNQDATLSRAVSELSEASSLGIRTVVDATVFGHGRDIDAVQAINQHVDINIVVATGIYTYDHLPFYFEYRKPARPGERDVITEMLVRDVTEGIAQTGVQAGIIKCVTDKAGLTPNVTRILRAAAIAHRETGVPITTHSDASERNGLDQQRVLEQEGVDLRRVIIGHSGDSADLDYLRALMDRGSLIGADRFGMYFPGYPAFEQRVDVVARLCALGYSDRIVLSHDYTCYSDWFPPGSTRLPAEWRLTHISEAVIPALRVRGVTEDQVSAMLVGNPRRLFARHGAY